MRRSLHGGGSLCCCCCAFQGLDYLHSKKIVHFDLKSAVSAPCLHAPACTRMCPHECGRAAGGRRRQAAWQRSSADTGCTAACAQCKPRHSRTWRKPRCPHRFSPCAPQNILVGIRDKVPQGKVRGAPLCRAWPLAAFPRWAPVGPGAAPKPSAASAAIPRLYGQPELVYSSEHGRHPPPLALTQLCDFGLAKQRRQTYVTGVTSLRGTLPWMAPEILSAPDAVDEKSDVFSFGVVM